MISISSSRNRHGWQSCYQMLFLLALVTTLLFKVDAVFAQAGTQVPFITDSRQNPGHIFSLDNAFLTRDAVYTNPDGPIFSIAFLDKDVYFVNANDRHIYRSNRCSHEIIYTHSTYVRDIAFNSEGKFFFSEASGASSDGKLFELDVNTGDTTLHVTIPLAGVDNYWAGNFAFDPDDVVYVSSGNRSPASLYRRDSSGYNKLYTSNDPISGFSFTGPDTLLYANHGQEIRKLEGFSSDTSVFRDTNAQWLNDIAFGASGDFSQLQDIDGDGEGDACDCDDNYMGGNESGADCGGSCGGTCPNCTPILKATDRANAIDIVFMRDKDDYGSDMKLFRENVRQIVNEAFLADPAFKASACNFNFYTFSGTADYEWNAGCSFTTPGDLYDKGNCPIADFEVIVATSESRYCRSGHEFSMNYSTNASGDLSTWSRQTAIHEFGHAKFNLSDEYCDTGNCDGSYWQLGSGQANVFHKQAACEKDSTAPANCYNFCPETICMDTAEHQNLSHWFTTAATAQADCQIWATANGLNTADCSVNVAGAVCAPNWQRDRAGTFVRACGDGGDGWWKADQPSCTMVGGTVFEPDCAARVSNVLARVNTCPTPVPGATSTTTYASAQEQQIKTLVLKLSVENGVFAAQNAELIYNFPPTLYLEEAVYQVELTDMNGEPLFNMAMHDPRELRIYTDNRNGPEIRNVSTQRFTLYLPVKKGMRRVLIRDSKRNESVLEVDLQQTISNFCLEYEEDGICL